MRGETKERWRELCERAVVEDDPDKFIETVQQLIQVLEDEEIRRRTIMGIRVPPGEKPAKLSYPLA